MFIRRKGQEAAEEVNIAGLHERVIYMLGRLHFRTSFSAKCAQAQRRALPFCQA